MTAFRSVSQFFIDQDELDFVRLHRLEHQDLHDAAAPVRRTAVKAALGIGAGALSRKAQQIFRCSNVSGPLDRGRQIRTYLVFPREEIDAFPRCVAQCRDPVAFSVDVDEFAGFRDAVHAGKIDLRLRCVPIDLRLLAQRDGTPIPQFVISAVRILKSSNCEGVFRIAPDYAILNPLATELERTGNITSVQLKDLDVHVVASLFKLFYRQLEPRLVSEPITLELR